MKNIDRAELLAYLDTEVQRQDARTRSRRAFMAGMLGFLGLLSQALFEALGSLGPRLGAIAAGLAAFSFLIFFEKALDLENRLVHPQASTTDLDARVFLDRVKLLARTGPGTAARLAALFDGITRILLGLLLWSLEASQLVPWHLGAIAGTLMLVSGLGDFLAIMISGKFMSQAMGASLGAILRVVDKSAPGVVAARAQISRLEREAKNSIFDTPEVAAETKWGYIQAFGASMKAVQLGSYSLAFAALAIPLWDHLGSLAIMSAFLVVLGFSLVAIVAGRLLIRLYAGQPAFWLEQIRFGLTTKRYSAAKAAYLVQLVDYLRSTDYTSDLSLDLLMANLDD